MKQALEIADLSTLIPRLKASGKAWFQGRKHAPDLETGRPHQIIGPNTMGRSYFHLHLVSDSTGETLISLSRAVSAQYDGISAIEHVYPLVRSSAQLARVLSEIETAPGIVLYTLVEHELSDTLEAFCKLHGCPTQSVLQPLMTMFQAYLGASSTARPGAQHMLNAEYFRRIDAMNYTLMHDDGQLPENLETADVILLGVSRTSKTPTAIYLANRGVKTANIPLVPGMDISAQLDTIRKPLVIGLTASPDRIVQIRQNRLLSLKADDNTAYVDHEAVAQEILEARKLFARRGWSVIDVSRRSIEETAAAILDLLREHRLKFIAQ
jgi:[pyruvate, water dikinase]-phosphate phosphotransferase / [pyruvate, water dikinase] kinase